MIEPYYQDEWTQIFLGDCEDILPQINQVDSIIVDPPYPIRFIPKYKDWFLACDSALKIGGTCFAMVGQYKLPDVLNSFPNTWEYLWCGCFEQRQMATSIWPRGISSAWKPLLIYGKQFTRFKPWKYDTISATGGYLKPKHGHKWGQDEFQFTTLIDRFDITGTICDPLMGKGTTLVAAKQLGRKSIGIEIEKKYCDIAVERLRQDPLPLKFKE